MYISCSQDVYKKTYEYRDIELESIYKCQQA